MPASTPLPQTAAAASRALRRLADPEKAKFLQGFLKTKPGQYGHGDLFLGIIVPDTREIGRRFARLPRPEIKTLLASPMHEERLLALIIMTEQFARGDAATRETLYKMYLRERRRVNNWDLVDLSAAQIVGAHLS
jgi:hypothetical protein